MGRFKPDMLERVESFSHRVLDVVDALEKRSVSHRILDQITGSGTSIGANVFEADEAMSRADFCKCLAISIKELNETRFWLRLVSRRNWLPPTTLDPLQTEATELKAILGTILHRSRQSPKKY